MRRLALIAVLLVGAAPAAAQYRWDDEPLTDHRGQWGLRVDPGLVFLSATRAGRTENGFAPALDLGVSRGFEDFGDELSIRARVVFGDPGGVSLLGGYRTYFGRGRLKTHGDVDLYLPFSPGPSLGLRLGLGLMWDPTESFGVSLGGGAFAAVGGALVTGVDVLLGVQLRF